MTDTIAATTAGKVRGIERDGIHTFRGIPFAAAPTGARRFRAPAPPEPWDDVRDALRASPVAPQPPSPLETMLGAPPPTWDEARCLTLNVWTPGVDDAARPVMVWIHGGAFVNGAGSTPIYSGRRFAEHGDVVVVTINYRLGAFGFLHLDHLDPAFAGSGNAGIADQIAALRWVRDNIAAFGGDPGRVTIFGESAGGMSVACLLAAPEAQGLFHAAIAQSGALSHVHPPDAAAAVTEAVMRHAGVTDPEGLVGLLAEDLVAAQVAATAELPRSALPFGPVADGVVLPHRPLEALAAGRAGAVPTLTGTTKDEMTLFLALDLGMAEPDPAAVQRQARRFFGDRVEEVLAAYRAHRPGAGDTEILTALTTDAVFRIPAIRLAEAQVRAGRPTWMYWFTWETPVMGGALRSCHALELPFVWDALDKPGLSMLTGDGPERHGIAEAMHRAWIAFARDHDPGWPGYDLARRATMRFDVTCEVVDDPDGPERALWDDWGTPRRAG